ncbi:MAG: alpha/beta hydrolase [bacterium]|nr:alpha/beta hydrolase [bacterium]
MKRCMLKVGILILFVLVTLHAGGTQKTVSADKVEIVYTALGSGKTAVVFIHGGFADRTFWSNQVKPFAEKYRVIAVDLAGHGESGDNRTKWTLAAFAEDVRAVIEKEKITRAVLVGNSLGGPVALETAGLVPGKVIGIVAVDTFHFFDVKYPPDFFKKQAAAFRSDFDGTMRQMIRALFKPDVDPKLRAWVEKKMSDNSPEMAAQIMESFVGYKMVNTLKKLKQPIRCINGDLYPTLIERNREIYPDFDAVILPGTGHYPMLERPDAFNRHLMEILEKMNR